MPYGRGRPGGRGSAQSGQGEGQKLTKFCERILWMAPNHFPGSLCFFDPPLHVLSTVSARYTLDIDQYNKLYSLSLINLYLVINAKKSVRIVVYKILYLITNMQKQSVFDHYVIGQYPIYY